MRGTPNDKLKYLQTASWRILHIPCLLFLIAQLEKVNKVNAELKLRLSDVIKSLPDSEEIRIKARELDEKDFLMNAVRPTVRMSFMQGLLSRSNL